MLPHILIEKTTTKYRKGNKMNLEAELFSLDGSERFYVKLSKDLSSAHKLGIEVGESLKNQSNNSYKK